MSKQTETDVTEALSDFEYGYGEHPTGLFSLDDVKRIDAAWCSGAWGETDQSFAWLVELKDGRWVAASGGCDYTGWGCQDHFAATVHATREEAVRLGLTKEERMDMGFEP